MTRTRLALLTGAAVVVLGVLFAATSLRAAAPADPLNPGIPTAPKGPDLPQPIHFSHKIHAGQLGMDCRYCHSFVEVAAHSNIPTTQVCMNCHSQIWADSPMFSSCWAIPAGRGAIFSTRRNSRS